MAFKTNNGAAQINMQAAGAETSTAYTGKEKIMQNLVAATTDISTLASEYSKDRSDSTRAMLNAKSLKLHATIEILSGSPISFTPKELEIMQIMQRNANEAIEGAAKAVGKSVTYTNIHSKEFNRSDFTDAPQHINDTLYNQKYDNREAFVLNVDSRVKSSMDAAGFSTTSILYTLYDFKNMFVEEDSRRGNPPQGDINRLKDQARHEGPGKPQPQVQAPIEDEVKHDHGAAQINEPQTQTATGGFQEGQTRKTGRNSLLGRPDEDTDHSWRNAMLKKVFLGALAVAGVVWAISPIWKHKPMPNHQTHAVVQTHAVQHPPVLNEQKAKTHAVVQTHAAQHSPVHVKPGVHHPAHNGPNAKGARKLSLLEAEAMYYATHGNPVVRTSTGSEVHSAQQPLTKIRRGRGGNVSNHKDFYRKVSQDGYQWVYTEGPHKTAAGKASFSFSGPANGHAWSSGSGSTATTYSNNVPCVPGKKAAKPGESFLGEVGHILVFPVKEAAKAVAFPVKKAADLL